MLVLFLLIFLPTLLFHCIQKSDKERQESRTLQKQSIKTRKKTLQQSTSLGTSRTSSSFEHVVKKEKIGSRMDTSKERAEEKKKSVKSKGTELKEDVTQHTELSQRSNAQKLFATEPNNYEKAAFADGTVLDPSKVKWMGGLEDEDERKKVEQLKELEHTSLTKNRVQSEETDGKKRVTILTEKCLLFEVPDEPTLDDEADEEPDPAII